MAKFDSSTLKKIGIYASGGDAPGMNAAIRAVVRMATYKNLEVVGILQGYTGMIKEEFLPMSPRSVANILQRGGSILKAGRCAEFLKPEYRTKAVENLKRAGIQACVCIGGDGSFRGAHALWDEHQYPISGVAGTIDNDIFGTDFTIGFDTAVNTAVEAIDKIRDTAASHDRLFIVEVMGRNSGYIASEVGLAGGAEAIFVPELPQAVETAVQTILSGAKKGKLSSIIVTAEGQKAGRSYDLAETIRKKTGWEARVCILGHIQRGGAPTSNDRNLASRVGAGAVDALLQGTCDVMIGVQADSLHVVPLLDTFSKIKPIDKERLNLAAILAT